MNQWKFLGLPRCRACNHLIWPWQAWSHIQISADGTEPPVNFIEPFHALCMTVVLEKVQRHGGTVRNLS